MARTHADFRDDLNKVENRQILLLKDDFTASLLLIVDNSRCIVDQ